MRNMLGEVVLVGLVLSVWLQNLRATSHTTVNVPVVLLGPWGILAAFGFGVEAQTGFGRVVGIGVRVGGGVQEEALAEEDVLGVVAGGPPALVPRRSEMGAGSPLTWTIELVQPMLELTTLDWCKYLAEIEHAQDGYGHVAAKFWS
ncbi:hypothetical protein B1218_36175, partial [Pseudomonas ogarae]